ncbi:MAG: hypothetical protein ACLGI9_14110 [Thermoanaerobaculia bacterium]
MDRSRRFLAFALLLWTGLGLASRVEAQEGGRAGLVRLVSPSPGARLVGGTTAEIEWLPLESFDRMEAVEEWEAFLSFDGGASYPFRITPHLDQELRRISWQVPDIPTLDARILLRFGDERQETALELPQRFSIAAASGPAGVFMPVEIALQRGEAARPRQAGVVAWVEGDRSGGSLRRRMAAEPASLHGAFELPEGHSVAVILTDSDPEGPGTEARRAPEESGSVPPPPLRRSLLSGETNPHRSVGILLLTQRQNE